MTEQEFDEYYPRFFRQINAIARKISGANENMYDDLVQVGRISLWKFDLTRVKTNEVGCINRHLRNRMIDFVRSEQTKAKMITLDDIHRPRIDAIFLDDSGIVVEARMSPHDPELRTEYDSWE